jgi:predicted esterase
MVRFSLCVAIFVVALRAHAQGAFDGEWRTSFGVVSLKQIKTEVTGTYGVANQFTLKGKVNGKVLSFEYQEGAATGEAQWTLDAAGNSFSGKFQIRGGKQGTWLGWRPDSAALKGKAANLAGLWLTDLGLMELGQTGDEVSGKYGLGGVSEIEGKVTGRRIEFTTKAFRNGKGWFDMAPDNAKFNGAGNTEGFAAWYGWRGRKAPEFARHAKLAAGKIVEGSTKNLLTYSVRAPSSYKPGDTNKWPTIIILHGSNMNAKAYVNTLAATWPDIARNYLIIGINGERPSDLGNEPAFNYTYVNFVGKSTYKGFPGTDRESPALVSEAMTELRDVYRVKYYFVGGHSQGGFLTYSLMMNYPELIAGAFPISAGLIFQSEPKAYADEKLKTAQRAVPLAIIHSKQDQVVDFAMGEYAAKAFTDAGWPAMKFFAEDKGAGHRFGLLPVGEAIAWLASQQK